MKELLFCASRLVFFGCTPHSVDFVVAERVAYAEQYVGSVGIECLFDGVVSIAFGRSGFIPSEDVIARKAQIEPVVQQRISD